MNTPNPSHAVLIAEVADLREKLRESAAREVEARHAAERAVDEAAAAQRKHILAAVMWNQAGNKEQVAAELTAALI